MIFWICGSFNCLFMVAIVWTEKNENEKLLAISKSCYDDFKGALRKKNPQVISGSKTLRLDFPSTIFCILLWNIGISRCCIKTFILPTPFLCVSSYKKPLSDYRPKTPPKSNLVNNLKNMWPWLLKHCKTHTQWSNASFAQEFTCLKTFEQSRCQFHLFLT